MICTQFKKSIKILRSDSGGEYISKEFSSYLSAEGILHKKSCPYTSKQNGVAERNNCHILETVRTSLVESLVLPQFWCEAAHTVIHIINRLPSTVLNKVSPFECLFGNPPSYIWGSLGASTLFTSRLLNVPNYAHKLLNACFLDKVMNIKDFFIIIPKIDVSILPGMLSF